MEEGKEGENPYFYIPQKKKYKQLKGHAKKKDKYCGVCKYIPWHFHFDWFHSRMS